MIKTKRGYFKVSFGEHTYYYLECNTGSFCGALMRGDLVAVSALACLEWNEELDLLERSNWPNVENELDLVLKIKRIRIENNET